MTWYRLWPCEDNRYDFGRMWLHSQWTWYLLLLQKNLPSVERLYTIYHSLRSNLVSIPHVQKLPQNKVSCPRILPGQSSHSFQIQILTLLHDSPTIISFDHSSRQNILEYSMTHQITSLLVTRQNFNITPIAYVHPHIQRGLTRTANPRCVL